MEYRSLGRTGLKVSPLCLGCMMFGPRGNNDHDQCIRIIHRALDAGINFLDTANVYSSGVSEEIVGKALKGRRDEVVLATKVHGVMGPGPNDRGNGRRHITQQVEASLRRLQTDYIDLYQIHRPDLDTPIEETMRTLDDLVHQGKVRYLGSSTFAAWQLVESYWTSDRLRLERFVCEQPPYSILSRGIEREVLPVCDKYGTGVIPWSPLHRGYLSGKYRKGEAPPADSRAKRDQFFEPLESESGRRKLEIVAEVGHLADELDVSLAQYALAWTLANPVVTAPIIGPRIMEQLESVLRVPEIRLPFEHLTRIDQLVAPGTDL